VDQGKGLRDNAVKGEMLGRVKDAKREKRIKKEKAHTRRREK
jgi:hypothetical protein